MTPNSYKERRGSANEYEYNKDTDTANALGEATLSELHLVGEINHEILNKP